MCVSPQLACPSRRRYYSRHGVPRAASHLSHPPHQFRIIRLATQHPVQPHRQLSSHSHLGDLTAAAKFQPPICSPQFRILSRRRLSGFDQHLDRRERRFYAATPPLSSPNSAIKSANRSIFARNRDVYRARICICYKSTRIAVTIMLSSLGECADASTGSDWQETGA